MEYLEKIVGVGQRKRRRKRKERALLWMKRRKRKETDWLSTFGSVVPLSAFE